MPTRLGAADFVTCPACGTVGERSGLCTLTRGETETVACDACNLWIRDGVLIERGVALDPDVVVELGHARAPLAPVDELYCAPDRRPVRLIASWAGHPAEGAPALPTVTSITLRLARPRDKS